MSNEERRRSSRISELEARNALQRSQKQSRMTLGRKDEQSDRKGARKKVKTRPLQDLISDPAEQQAHVLEPQIKKLLSDAFKSVQHYTSPTTPMDPRTPLADQSKLEMLLTLLQRRDQKKIFAEPVDPTQVEGYQDVIKFPMDFSTIGIKLSRGKYKALEDFEDDVFLVFDNAMRFNQSTTVFYRQARAIREVAEKLFHALRTDPSNFETHFLPVIERDGRWTKAEARLLNFTDWMISSGERGKRNEDSADQRRQTYQPPGKGKSLASDDPEDRTTLVQAKEELDYKGSVMRFVEDLGPTVKFIATRNLCQNLPHGSVPENEVPHLQTQAVTLDASNISQDSFHQVAAARSVHQGSVHQKAVPALTDFSYRNPTKPPHLNLPAKSSNFYGGNALAIGGMNRSEDPSFIIPEARHTLAYPTHQTGQETNYINKGLDIANDSERDMTAGILYSSSFYQPAATTLNGNPNPFATWNFAPDSQGSNFSKMMQDAMMTDGLAKKGEPVSSYPAMQATAAKGKSPLLPSWQEPSQGAISFPRNDYKDLDWTLQAAPIPEESSLPVGQRSNCLNPTNEGISTGAGQLPHWLSPTDGGNSTGAGQLPHWLSPTNDGISTGAGRLPHWLSPSKESSSLGAGPVLNWLSLSHGGGSDHAPNCANPVTSKPQFFEFLCPPQSRPAEADVMGQARIPNQQDQVPLHDARLGSAFDVQDAGTRDRKGKSVMENEAAIHHPSSSSNVQKWFLG